MTDGVADTYLPAWLRPRPSGKPHYILKRADVVRGVGFFQSACGQNFYKLTSDYPPLMDRCRRCEAEARIRELEYELRSARKDYNDILDAEFG